MTVETDAGFGLYVHWPFCLAKCPYCDFNSHVRDRIDHAAWRRALRAELSSYAARVPNRGLTSIFFGGGTPSLMAPETVAAVIDDAASLWHMAGDVEITLEANPTSVEAGRFAGFRAAGVNRLSLGVQALNDADLRALGRGHSAAEARAAIDLAAATFPRFSFDLIYARPGQTLPSWERELAEALSLAAGHVSVYQLTLEDGTVFQARHRRGELSVPDDELGADLYALTQDRLAAAGLPAYEISNHARAGEACRHNLVYWRGGDYVGIGPGAHGRLTLPAETGSVTWATRNHRAPEVWLQRVEQAGQGGHPPERLGQPDRLVELLMMGLRLTEGISRPRFRAQMGADVTALLPSKALALLCSGGLLVLEPQRLRATPAGLLRLNAVLARLLPGLS